MSPLQRLPPLNALRAFEAVARHSSFARAAQELHVTKAAVAQQVRALEQEIGARLVERNGRGLQLTESGSAGAATLAEGFALLAKAARAMREGDGRRFLIINSAPSFAATWLVGRIGKFKARHPETDVLIDANPIDEALESGDADALIRWGAGEFPGLAVTLRSRRTCFQSARLDSSLATIRSAHPRISPATPSCTSIGTLRTPPGQRGPTGLRPRARAMSRPRTASSSTTWR
jgi:LysR family transcriptional regulator, glycine cleavage system transcriptional activator